MAVLTILAGLSFIIFFGFLAEFIFKKTGLPDVLFLIAVGIFAGPVFHLLDPGPLEPFAPVFTAFALLFLLFEGAFNLELRSFARGLGKTFAVTLSNFCLSVIAVTAVLLLFRLPPLVSLLGGFILGGISSAYVVPVLKRIPVKGETASIITLEAAMTDVLCIVTALAAVELITLQTFDAGAILTHMASLFLVAGVIGVIAGLLWIVLVLRIFREQKSYMVTIAYVTMVYVVTEFLNGNGAIATLFLGLMLKNSWEITSFAKSLVQGGTQPSYGVAVTTPSEEFFYGELSFLLKTFFFIFVGLLVDFSDLRALLVSLFIALALFGTRLLSGIVVYHLPVFDRRIVQAIFARGLAAAAIAQILIIREVPFAMLLVRVVYGVIVMSIAMSSVAVFLVQRRWKPEASVSPPIPAGG